MQHQHTPYHFNLIFSNLLFGINFSVFVSLIQTGMAFQQIFMLQIAASALFFIPRALFSPRSYRIAPRDMLTIFAVTVLIVYGWMFMLLWGASYTNPIDASTIATLGPAITLVAANIGGREKNLSGFRMIGILFAAAGAALLIFDHGSDIIHGSEAYGNILILLSVTAAAVNTVIIKPVLERYGTMPVMGWYYMIGLAITAPFFRHHINTSELLQLPIEALSELGYLLLLGTVLPSYLLYRATEKLTYVHTALYRYLQPLATTVLALLRGQERIDRTNVIAAALIFIGIVMVVTGYELVRHRVNSLTAKLKNRRMRNRRTDPR